ncbi:MAG: prevent-host-death protein [Acidobacteria bacterium]|nr:prevent-host-death protein [Acidobacteriota bacterium]MXZ37498.1 prevent-host-death protein [Holophagales bacterium]MYF03454.1 prevent-host-death protein [Holophagales bacterium]
MRSVDLETLSSRLSRYVRLAAAGETVLITDRDRVVAEIVPPRPERSPLVTDALLAEAVRNGLLAPPAIRGKGPPSKPPPIMSLNELLVGLDADREDR